MPHQASDGRQAAPGMQDAYTATQADLQTFQNAYAQVALMQPNTEAFNFKADPNRYIYVAAFDGTGNDATQTITERTNVHALYQNFDNFIHGDGQGHGGFSRMHARYIEGPGTQNTWGNALDNMRGDSVQDRVFEMYKDLGDKTRQWKQENPDAEISVITFGFSRGAVEAAEFASVVGKLGIQAELGHQTQKDDDARNFKQTWGEWWRSEPGTVAPDKEFKEVSGELVAPGKVPIAAALFDPVATGIAEQHDRALPKEISTALQITAQDEHRVFFPVNRIVTDGLAQSDPQRFANITVAGCHSDIGGGYADGKGLAQLSNNVMGTYLNQVVGHDICKTQTPDPQSMVVHDSNVGAMKNAGYAQTRYWFADRTQDAPYVAQDGYHVMSGVDQNIIGKKHVAMDAVNMHPGGSVDDSLRPRQAAPEARLDARQDDAHLPRPHAEKVSLQDESIIGPQRQRTIDTTHLLLESSTRISTLMDHQANPTTAALLHGKAQGAQDSRDALGDSAQGRLSAAVALAAKNNGMDRIGDISFSPDRNQLIITDRRETHTGSVKQATVDIDAAMRTPMTDTMRALDPARPQTLYEQAHQRLQQLPGVNGSPEELVNGAARIASQARSNGLTAIDQLEVRNHQGQNMVVAHQGQDGAHRESAPVDATRFVAQPQPQNPQQNLQQDAPQQNHPVQQPHNPHHLH